MQIFPFPLSSQFRYLLYFPTESLIRCVWILLLLQSTVTSEDLCKCSIRNIEIKVEFFSVMCFFLMFINAVCGLFLTIKKFKSGICFSSQLNFISHYKKMWFWEWIYRESWKSVCNCLYSKGAGDGERFRNRISITSHHFPSYFCLLLKLFSWQKMLLWPSFSFWLLG